MATTTIYANGTSTVFTIAANSKVAVAVTGPNTRASLFYRSPVSGQGWIRQAEVSGSTEYLSAAVSVTTEAYIEVTGPDNTLYNVGTAPILVSTKPGICAGNQGAPAAKTVSATLSAAELLTKIITVQQGAAGASVQTLPTGTNMDLALPEFAADDSFDFFVINKSTVDAEDASLSANTGWTTVGAMDIPANSAAGSLNASAHFRARKTGTAAWTLYRLS